jgi:hypothetical protein
MSLLPIIYLVFFAQEPLYQTWQKQRLEKPNTKKAKTKKRPAR